MGFACLVAEWGMVDVRGWPLRCSEGLGRGREEGRLHGNLHKALFMGPPPLLQAGGPVSMVATAGLLTAEGDLPSALHPLPMDPTLFYPGMFYGGQQLR